MRSRTRSAARAEKPPFRVGWVFAGGGARGAYEVGVCQYLFDVVRKELGGQLPLDVISGTSVGALHACALASWAHDPATGLQDLANRWTSLSLDDVIRVDRRRSFNMIRALFGRPPRNPGADAARGGLLDPRPLEQLLSSAVDFARIEQHVRSGRLWAVSLTATHVGSGQAAVFYRQNPAGEPFQASARTRMHATILTKEHALASAAIPFLFPAVRVAGQLYCDGSLRQHVPLAPARQLGADALLVVNPRSLGGSESGLAASEHEQSFPGPLFLLGKTMNALTLDRIDGDIEQIERINRMLAAGERRFGAGFVSGLNAALDEEGASRVKSIPLLHVHASADIGQRAAAFVRSSGFRGRRFGLIERTFRRLGEAEGKHEADLLSYLLFDGRFTGELIALGQEDARRQHSQLVNFFAPLVDAAAA